MTRMTGNIMMAAGILIGGASGLCTFVATGIMLSDEHARTLNSAILISVFGIPPMLLGLGLFLGGRSVSRNAEK